MTREARDLEEEISVRQGLVDQLNAEIEARRDALRNMATAASMVPVRALLMAHKMQGPSVVAEAIACHGPFGKFQIPSRAYDIGCIRLPAEIVQRARVCNLAEYMDGVFRSPGQTLYDQVETFLSTRWQDLRSYDLYVLAVGPQIHGRGPQKSKRRDLPNVNFVITKLFMERLPDHDFVVCDPRHRESDPTAHAINLSHVYRRLRGMDVRVRTPKNTTGVVGEGMDVVLYQRGTGQPSLEGVRAIQASTGLGQESIMHMQLVPGKESVGIMGGNCYKDFQKSVSMILHQFALVDKLCAALHKPFINDVKIVLDPFSAYAAFTAVAVLGYGLADMCHVLAGRHRNGVLVYTSIP